MKSSRKQKGLIINVTSLDKLKFSNKIFLLVKKSNIYLLYVLRGTIYVSTSYTNHGGIKGKILKIYVIFLDLMRHVIIS